MGWSFCTQRSVRSKNDRALVFVEFETVFTDVYVSRSDGDDLFLREWSSGYGTFVDNFPLSVFILGDLGMHAEHFR